MKAMSLLVCLGLGMGVLAKHNGDYLNALNGDYVTEHYEFVTSPQPSALQTLFILTRGGARDAVEIVQRVPMSATYFLTVDWSCLATEDMYESAVEGTSIYEKEQELSHALDSSYDVCLIGTQYFGNLPEESQYRILKAVEKGMGLVLVNGYRRPPYGKLFKRPLPKPDFVTSFPAPTPSFEFRAYQLGLGRVVEVHWGRISRGRSCLPVLDYSNRWKAHHENASAFMGMVCRYAAGRETEPVQPRMRIRNVWNEDVTGQTLPGGTYYRDELGNNGVCRVSGFAVPSAVGALSLVVPETVVPGASFAGKLSLERGYARPLTAKVELFDSPYRRIWYRRSQALPAGQCKLEFRVEGYPMPTLAGYVRVTLSDVQGQAVAVTDRPVFFPDRSLDDYMQLGWDTVWGENGELLAPQLVDRLGWRLGMAHPSEGGRNARDMALLNQKLVSHTVRIMLNKSSNGGVCQSKWFFLPKKLEAHIASLKGDECFYRPEVQELWRQGLRYRIQNLGKYSTAIYNLGDENELDTEAGYGPSDLIYFRKFLAKKYGSISKLNAVYGSSYGGFDEVPHLPLKTALKQKNYAAWADHRGYMEQMYADLHAFLREEIQKVDPGAPVGAEGSVPGNLEETIRRLEYWGPYSDPVGDELLRSFGGDKIRMLWWGGYPGSHGGRGDHPVPLLRDLLLGTVNGNAWFSSLPGSNHSCFDCDFDFADYVKRYLPDMDRMKAGAAQLMIRNPMENVGVLFYWSHASSTAQMATGKTVSPKSGLPVLISSAYRLGLGFEFVSSRTLDRLATAKILFLCGASALSDEECQAILAFVRRGGTVIADAVPAVMDENLRIRQQNGLAELFGPVTYGMATGGKAGTRGLDLPGGKAHKIVCYGEPLLQRKSYGHGVAVLTNCSLASMANTAMPLRSFDRWMAQQAGEAGIGRNLILEQASDSHVLRIRQGKDFLLAGLICDPRDMANKPVLRFPRPLHVYGVDVGYVGQKDHLVVDFSSSILQLFALFEQRQSPPKLGVSGTRLGDWLQLTLPRLVAGRMLRLEILDSSGHRVFVKVFDREAIRPRPAVAYTDRPGHWEARLTDVATGLSTRVQFEVKP